MPCNYLTKITNKQNSPGKADNRHIFISTTTQNLPFCDFFRSPFVGHPSAKLPPSPLQFGCSKGGHLVLMKKTQHLTTFQHLQRGAKWFRYRISILHPLGFKEIPPPNGRSRFVVVFFVGVLKTFPKFEALGSPAQMTSEI